MSLATIATTVHLADGRQLTVEVRNPDKVRWESTAALHKWPTPSMDADGNLTMPAPTLMTTFLAWAALTRTDQYSGKWEQFRDADCLDIESVEAEPDPTQQAVGTDSPTS